VVFSFGLLKIWADMGMFALDRQVFADTWWAKAQNLAAEVVRSRWFEFTAGFVILLRLGLYKWEQTQCQPPVSSTPLLESNSWCIFSRG